mmetsp:Transcript_9207/g.29319  ORF Transcript_9207/g.29319 Transcript_9207/m.29319 type:complete len:120 (+) Transcript_9207:104-463(+)
MAKTLLDSLAELPGFNGYILAAHKHSSPPSSSPAPSADLPLVFSESGSIPADLSMEMRRIMLLACARGQGGGVESMTVVRGQHKMSVSSNGRFLLAVSWEVGKLDREGPADGEYVPEGL